MLIVMVFLYAMPLLNRQTKGMLSNYISHHPLLPCISQNKFLAASSAHFASGKVLYFYTGCLIACLSCSFFFCKNESSRRSINLLQILFDGISTTLMISRIQFLYYNAKKMSMCDIYV